MAKIYATGRRKASIAKVWLTPGTGNITINGLSLDAWLGGLEAKKLRVKQPLALTKQDTTVDIVATTLGGGFGGQADASIFIELFYFHIEFFSGKFKEVLGQ